MTADQKRHVSFVLMALAALSGLLAAWIAMTGGFRASLFGIPISLRDEYRAAVLAIGFGAGAWALLERGTWRRWYKTVREQLTRRASLQPGLARSLWVVPFTVAAAVLWAGLTLGTKSAGGADSYGYVSQAKLWLGGDLYTLDDRPADPPWPDADATFTPLGYKPTTSLRFVPIYSPGLPLLMALSQLAIGECGPFLVVPLCAALLVWLTYLLGARVSREIIGVIASLCVATCPAVVIMTMSPMSDVPAAAFWTASLVLACRSSALTTAAAGAVAGVAITIRPNLAPLAAFPLALAMLPVMRAGIRPAARRALLFSLACGPAVLFVGWWLQTLYGSPFESGYGRASGIYSVAHVSANLTRYPLWLWETQGPVPFLFLLTPWLALRRGEDKTTLRWLLFGFVIATFAGYVAYQPFEEWWYLRFLLPAFPALFVLAFDAARRIGEMIGGLPGRSVAVAIALVGLYHGAAVTIERDILHVAEGEQKYADAGRFIARRLPRDAVLLTMQHSGSARLYSGRLTVRYDFLDPEWLDRSLDYLRSHGREPYLLLEDWEVPIFRERFAGQKGAAAVEAEPLAMLPGGNVLLFSTDDRRDTRIVTEIMPRTSGCAVAHR
jgi:hypothetical protein